MGPRPGPCPRYLPALGLRREHQAGPDRVAVDQHRAGAAHAVLAAQVGAGEPELVPQKICERGAHVGQTAAALAERLQGEGKDSFDKSWGELLKTIADKRGVTAG